MANDDMDLVREYARTHSEQAFATLVSRHLNMVYSVGLRQTRDPQLAEEIAQTVFVILARKAGNLGPGTILSGWLCRAACFAAANAQTIQRRRQRREQEALMQFLGEQPESQDWERIAPLLDTALGRLGEADRNAIVLRFIEGRSFHEVAAALGASEDAAKKRVHRALLKLRKFFSRHGVALSTAAIAAAVATNSVQAAPAGLAGTVTTAAVGETLVTHSTLTLTKSTLKLMAWTKMKSALVAAAAAILAAGGANLAIRSASPPTGAAKSSDRTPAPDSAGNATPEDTLKSLARSARAGDFEGFSAGLTPDQVKWFAGRMKRQTPEESKRALMDWGKLMASAQITQKEVVSDNEVNMRIQPLPDDPRSDFIRFQKIGDNWKLAGEAH